VEELMKAQRNRELLGRQRLSQRLSKIFKKRRGSMKNKLLPSPFPLPYVVNGAISPFDQYCMGYMNPGNSGYGYISTMKLSVDMVSIEGLDAGTEALFLMIAVKRMMPTLVRSTCSLPPRSAG
jgi:hypothetical protein